MSTVLEIESAIAKLTPDEARSIAGWLNSQLPRLDQEARNRARRNACGMWKDRTDLPDIRELRAEWNNRITL
jgi:hypothetical protein